jgi:hypothetical protein
MKSTMIWVLSFSILGPVPESGELAKYKTKEECQEALQQKQEEYKLKHKAVVGNCRQSTK